MLTDHDATPPPAETPGAATDEPATTPGGTATTDNGSSTVETSLLFAAEAFIMTLYFTNTIFGSELEAIPDFGIKQAQYSSYVD